MLGWLFGSFTFFLLIGTPIAACLGLAAVLTIVHTGMRINLMVLAQTMFAGMTSYQLMAIPLFILCGNLMTDGGLSQKLVDFIGLFCRKSRGALAYVTIIASAFFAAISGSSPATTAAIGGVMAPEMQKNGYNEDFSLATAAAAGTLGQIIPPSVCRHAFSDGLRPRHSDGHFHAHLCASLRQEKPAHHCQRKAPHTWRIRESVLQEHLGAYHADHHPRRHLLRPVYAH